MLKHIKTRRPKGNHLSSSIIIYTKGIKMSIKKYTQTIAEEVFKNNKLYLVDKFINTTNRLDAFTSEGYLVKVSINQLNNGSYPSIISKHNPYSYYNCNKLFTKNKLTLLEDKYLGYNVKMRCLNEEGYQLVTTVSQLLINRKPMTFHKSNPYTIHNIKLWLNKNKNKFKSNITINDNQIFKGVFSKLSFECSNCGTFEQHLDALRKGHGCAYCTNQKVKIGLNDIATTHSHLLVHFTDKKDATKYTYGAEKILLFKCDRCGYNKDMPICELSNSGFSCDKCADGKSIPNKFLFNIFCQLKYKIKPEKIFKNSKFRYDLYVKTKNQNYTIEAHGMQHYQENTNYKISLKDQKENDKNKREFSESLNNIHIEIDCRHSKFDYLKEQFIKSLSPYFDLSEIDWSEVYSYSFLKSLLIESCLIRDKSDNTKSVKTISKQLNMSVSTIKRYLIVGNELGLCVFDKSKESIKNKKRGHDSTRKMVNKYSTNGKYLKTYNSLVSAKNENDIISGSVISECCSHKRKTAGGFIWRYYEENKNTNNIIGFDFTVNQYTKCGKFLRSYTNIKQAMVQTNIKGIYNCCNGMCKTAGGYIWKYKNK